MQVYTCPSRFRKGFVGAPVSKTPHLGCWLKITPRGDPEDVFGNRDPPNLRGSAMRLRVVVRQVPG